MYPLITIGDIKIYIFGVFLLIAWIVFFYLLHIFGQKKSLVRPVFTDIASFTISMFLFGRLFDMFSKWRDTKFLFQGFFTGERGFFDFFHAFFINDNYNLSLAGGIIGFCIVFFYKIRKRKQFSEIPTYIDIIMPAFIGAAIIGYIGALFGGQVYGVPSNMFFAINYNTKQSLIPGILFPLPIFYILALCGLMYLYFHLSKKDNLPDGYIGYILMGIFGLILFIGEFFSGSPDMFEVIMRINQLIGLIFIVTSIVGITKFFRS